MFHFLSDFAERLAGTIVISYGQLEGSVTFIYFLESYNRSILVNNCRTLHIQEERFFVRRYSTPYFKQSGIGREMGVMHEKTTQK